MHKTGDKEIEIFLLVVVPHFSKPHLCCISFKWLCNTVVLGETNSGQDWISLRAFCSLIVFPVG